jgi:hypothetical protein
LRPHDVFGPHGVSTPLALITRRTVHLVPCDYCGAEFDPIATRWLCPHCHMKANCCDGAPLAFCGTTRPAEPNE